MTWRRARVVLAALLVLAGACSRTPTKVEGFSLQAPGPPLPAGWLAFDSDRHGNFEVYSLALPTGTATPLTSDPRYDSWDARLSPDRTRILFYRSPAGVHDNDYTKVSLWMMNTDGTAQTQLIAQGAYGWGLQGHAEWSPDGTHLAMVGGVVGNPQLFVTNIDGSSPRQVTNRGGVNLDPSWSPDGTRLVFVGCPKSVCYVPNQEIYTIAASGAGSATRMTNDNLADYDPAWSPDGTTIAWLTAVTAATAQKPGGTWGIRAMSANGSGQHYLINDGNVNSRPNWSRDGSTIYFHRLAYGTSVSFQLYAMAKDGTNMREITTGQPGNNEYPSP